MTQVHQAIGGNMVAQVGMRRGTAGRWEPRPVPPAPTAPPADPVDVAAPPEVAASATPRGPALRRRPNGYWQDVAHVDAEVRRIWQQLGEPGRLPGQTTLGALGPPGLRGGIMQHGGLRALAQRLGLRPCHTPTHLLREDPAALERELRAFIAGQPDPTLFPAAKILRAAGRADLATAIRATGGARAWAARLGVRPARMPAGY